MELLKYTKSFAQIAIMLSTAWQIQGRGVLRDYRKPDIMRP